jgi:hypothetical protein
MDLEEEYVNQAAKALADAMDQTLLLEMTYPESYAMHNILLYNDDVVQRCKWIDDHIEGEWAYYNKTFYFSNRKQKALFLLRWAE